MAYDFKSKRASKRELSSIHKGNYLGISNEVSNASFYFPIVVVLHNKHNCDCILSRSDLYFHIVLLYICIYISLK